MFRLNLRLWLAENRLIVMRKKTYDKRNNELMFKLEIITRQRDHLWEVVCQDKNESMRRRLEKSE